MACKLLSEPLHLNTPDDEELTFDLYENGQQQDYSGKRIKEIFNEWYELLVEYMAWDDGHFTVSITEFRELPAIYKDAYRIYKNNVTKRIPR